MIGPAIAIGVVIFVACALAGEKDALLIPIIVLLAVAAANIVL